MNGNAFIWRGRVLRDALKLVVIDAMPTRVTLDGKYDWYANKHDALFVAYVNLDWVTFYSTVSNDGWLLAVAIVLSTLHKVSFNFSILA